MSRKYAPSQSVCVCVCVCERMCCWDQENQFHDDDVCGCGETGCLWVGLLLTFTIASGALIFAGIDRHTNNHQSSLIDKQLGDASKTETVINTVVSETYYGIARDPTTGVVSKDHIPGSILIPKNGVLYEKAHCIMEKNSAFGSMFMMEQFEMDSRTSSPSSSSRSLISEYERIQIVFEIPFGDVMDVETGSGYTGFNTGGPANDGYEQYNPNIQTTRKRCGVPYCPDYSSIFTYQGVQDDAFAKLVGEHHMLSGGLYERIVTSQENGTMPLYTETLIPTRISCGCTAETPPRFACTFSASQLHNRHGWYRLDIAFKYLLKPIAKNPLYP